jgi:hypothetical protein
MDGEYKTTNRGQKEHDAKEQKQVVLRLSLTIYLFSSLYSIFTLRVKYCFAVPYVNGWWRSYETCLQFLSATSQIQMAWSVDWESL